MSLWKSFSIVNEILVNMKCFFLMYVYYNIVCKYDIMKQCMLDLFYFLLVVKVTIPLLSFNSNGFGIHLIVEYFLLQYLLRAAALTENNAFAFLKVDSPGDYITYSGFCQALCQVAICSHKCLKLWNLYEKVVANTFRSTVRLN